MGYKLIACDLDGTLLNDERLVPERNIAAIKKAREEYGVKFVPATGRGYDSIQGTLEDLGLLNEKNEYVLSFNGGALTENFENRIIQYKGLDFEKTKELFEYGLTKDVCIHIYTQTELYVYNLTDPTEREGFEKGKIRFHEQTENVMDFLKTENIAKILYQNTDVPYLMSFEDDLKRITDGYCEVSYSSERYMEINRIGINKAQGLHDLADLLGIDISETIAVGDSYNDLSMLEVAGLSVAAANAVPDVKKICDYVSLADNNEGVVADLLEKYVFN